MEDGNSSSFRLYTHTPLYGATGVCVISVSTYDSQDHKDAMRMRATRRTPGIEQTINHAMLTDKGEIILPTA